MRNYRYLILAALTVPALAIAQVGPNPAVRGGSLDPSIRGSTDRLTAPQDAQATGRASGNVLNRSIEKADVPVEADATVEADAEVRTGETTGVGASTETGTETHTKGMEPGPKRR